MYGRLWREAYRQELLHMFIVSYLGLAFLRAAGCSAGCLARIGMPMIQSAGVAWQTVARGMQVEGGKQAGAGSRKQHCHDRKHDTYQHGDHCNEMHREGRMVGFASSRNLDVKTEAS